MSVAHLIGVDLAGAASSVMGQEETLIDWLASIARKSSSQLCQRATTIRFF